MLKPLLIEIGVEELPAIAFLKELPNIERKYSDILEKYSLLSEFEFFYTPRRLLFFHNEFALKQEDTIKEFFGAPLSIAIKDGKPTNAGLGFAKKCGVDFDRLQVTTKGNKEVLYFKSEIKGKNSADLLNNIVNELILSLKFGKSMRWGDLSDNFIRPIRSLSIILGEEIINGSLFGINSFNTTFVHRSVSYNAKEFRSIKEYFTILKDAGVILYQDEREKKILQEFQEIELKYDIKIEVDEILLAEIVAITEYPTALIGNFDEQFLKLPNEVIITSMKEHQRYFPVQKGGKLINSFIVISNAITDDYSLIVKGNEKVLKARLSDALFFWNNDLKRGLDNSGLEKLLFVDGLGSVMEKVEREKNIALYLYRQYNLRISASYEDMIRAVELSKSDLMSDMVYEFTELQAIMGYYYALEQKEPQNIANAIKEQYLPKSEHGSMPTSLFSSILALSHKLDNLIGLFSIGMLPSGSRDPFALRRAVVGIIKIVIDNRINFNFKYIINTLKKDYKEFDSLLLEEFFIERFNKFFNVNSSVVRAVLSTGERDIYLISQKIEALNSIVNTKDYREFSTTFRRVANITKDLDMNLELRVDEKLLTNIAEQDLYAKYSKIKSSAFNSYESELDSLLSLKPTLDNFFDNVMVNDENIQIRVNRKNLIANIYKSFFNIADVSIVTT